MNKARRQELGDVVSQLDEVIDRIQEIRDEEECSYDAMPEGLQSSSRGDKMQGAMGSMDNVISNIEVVKSSISKIIDSK